MRCFILISRSCKTVKTALSVTQGELTDLWCLNRRNQGKGLRRKKKSKCSAPTAWTARATYHSFYTPTHSLFPRSSPSHFSSPFLTYLHAGYILFPEHALTHIILLIHAHVIDQTWQSYKISTFKQCIEHVYNLAYSY